MVLNFRPISYKYLEERVFPKLSGVICQSHKEIVITRGKEEAIKLFWILG